MLGAVLSACSASTWATLTRSMRVAPLFQQTLGGLKVGVDRRLAAHGFDEFFGNLYHLNAEEEPENPDYPTEEAPLLRAALLRRGVITPGPPTPTATRSIPANLQGLPTPPRGRNLHHQPRRQRTQKLPRKKGRLNGLRTVLWIMKTPTRG